VRSLNIVQVLKRKAGAKMAFVVRADSKKPGEGAFIVDKATRVDAFETAVGLLGQGMSGVTIMGDDGRVYQAIEFAEFLDEDS
jgi:hypothetical protein